MLAVLALASCTAETDAPLSTEPLLGTSSLDNTQITTETAPPVFTSAPIVRDMSNVTDEKELIELVNGYINRVYDIGDEYRPEYVDESTSAEDMISSVNQNGVTCKVKEIVIAGFEKINNIPERASLRDVWTEDHAGRTVQPGSRKV